MERIWGPVNGFYLAAYAAPAAAGDRFCSYAKVCWARPDSYWEADAAFKIFGGEHHASEDGALRAVAVEATNEISCLPVRPRRLTGRRRLSWPRLNVAGLLHHRTA